MTTLPTIPTSSHRHPAVAPTASDSVSEPAVVARIVWRVLRRDRQADTPRGGEVRTSRVEAVLGEETITLRHGDGDLERSGLVLPARLECRETAAGRLVEWWCPDDAGSPECRLLLTPGAPPLLRGRLLDRLGVSGGTHDVEQIRFDSDIEATESPSSAGS